MNNYSEFSAFIESVCTKVGCPDAAPYLQQGFRAYVESLSDTYADDKEARSKLKTKLIRHTPNGDEIVHAVSRSMNQPEAIPERHTKFIGKAAEKPKWLTREDVEKAVDAEHPDWTNGKGSAYLHTFKPREDLIKERQVSQFDDANSEIARQNADRLSKAPFEQIKAMFPKAYCKIQAEVWVRKFLKTETDPNTKQKTVLGAVGSWEPHVDDEHYPNPTMAADAAKRKYRPGHWQVFTVIPELRKAIPNLISSDM
jgi:hypothetical protein